MEPFKTTSERGNDSLLLEEREVTNLNPPKKIRRVYLSTRIKFMISMFVGFLWFSFSFYLGQTWIRDLSQVVGPVLAYMVILSIAFVPGFLNMFLAASLILDRQPRLVMPQEFPPITILIAAYNEENIILETLRGIAGQDYPSPIDIVVVDDGSTDGTIDLLRTHQLPNIKLIEADHGGKASALNKGLREITNDIIITIDADTFLHPQAVRRLVSRYLSDPADTAAVAGSVMVKNSRESFFSRLQEFDYFLAIASVKRQQGLYQGTLVAQGAFSLFRKSLVEKVSGWPNVIGEDIVMTWALIKDGHRIGYEPTAIAFTNVPTDYRGFARQRKRWARGMIEGLRTHYDLIYKRRSLTAVLIAMNFLYPPLDFAYSFLFIPGVILALTGRFWIAGPMTLAVLPLVLAISYVMFRFQRQVFGITGLSIRKNRLGFVLYVIIYQFIMAPISVAGYLAELSGRRKRW